MRHPLSVGACASLLVCLVACNVLLGNDNGRYREGPDDAGGGFSSSGSFGSEAGASSGGSSGTPVDGGSSGVPEGGGSVCADFAGCAVVPGIAAGTLDLTVDETHVFWAAPSVPPLDGGNVLYAALVNGMPGAANVAVAYNAFDGLATSLSGPSGGSPTAHLYATTAQNCELSAWEDDHFAPKVQVTRGPLRLIGQNRGVAWLDDTGVWSLQGTVPGQQAAAGATDLAANSVDVYAVIPDHLHAISFANGIPTAEWYDAPGIEHVAVSSTQLFVTGGECLGGSICTCSLDTLDGAMDAQLETIPLVEGTSSVRSMYFANGHLYWTGVDGSDGESTWRCAQPGPCTPQRVLDTLVLDYSHNTSGTYLLTATGAVFVPAPVQ